MIGKHLLPPVEGDGIEHATLRCTKNRLTSEIFRDVVFLQNALS